MRESIHILRHWHIVLRRSVLSGLCNNLGVNIPEHSGKGG
jgi:hypothetical protein